MGITSPQQLTESQQEVQDAQNPLGRYGFLSAKDKELQAQRRALYQQQMDRENEIMQQNMLNNMSSQKQIGYGAGNGLMNLIKQLKGGGAIKDVKGIEDMGNDPQIDRLNQLVAELGDKNTAMEILGQETGNAQMIADAQSGRRGVQKENLELQDLTKKVNDPNRDFEHKPGYSREIDTEIDGKPAVYTETLLSNTADGGIWKRTKPAIKGSVTGDKESFGRTAAGINKDIETLQSQWYATTNSLDSIDKLTEIIGRESQAGGNMGTMIGKGVNFVHGLQNAGKVAAQAFSKSDETTLVENNMSDKARSRLSEIAGANAELRATLIAAAYATAAANGDSGRSLSDKDVSNVLETFGADINDPQTFLKIMQNNREKLVGQYENRLKSIDTKSGTYYDEPSYRKRADEFRTRITPKQSGISKEQEAKDRARLEELRIKHAKGKK
jgi:hypothetical protein